MSQQPPIDPNWITSARLPLAPLAVMFLLTGTVWGTVVAAVLALLLELTDLLDGWMARKYNAVSDFGKLYDPFSDAFTRFTLFLGLLGAGVAELWMVIIIFYRDASVSFFRQVAGSRGTVLAARKSGKIKAIVQGVGTQLVFIALVAGKLYPASPIPAAVAWWVMVVITGVTAWSFVDYYLGNRALLGRAWNDEPEL